jgi:hypothetical protein
MNFLLLGLGRFALGRDRLEPAIALVLARGEEGVLMAQHPERELSDSDLNDVGHVGLRRARVSNRWVFFGA